MNSNRTSDLVHILTGAAVLIGLLLVFYELRQAKSLTLAELISQAYFEMLENDRTIMGENPSTALSKACYSPATLSREDLVILHAFYEGQMAQISRLRVLENIADFGVPWEGAALSFMMPVLATEHGKWWFGENYQSDPKMAEIAENVEVKHCQEYYGDITQP